MTTNDSWRRYLEAGAAVGQVTLARAEGIARGLFAPDDEERETAWRDLDELTRFGRLMGDQLIDMARAEMSRQLETLGAGSLVQFLDRIADLVRSQPVDAPSRSAEPATMTSSIASLMGRVDAPFTSSAPSATKNFALSCSPHSLNRVERRTPLHSALLHVPCDCCTSLCVAL